MMSFTITRLQAACLGCGLAVIGCLITRAPHPEAPPPCAFELPHILGSWELLQQTSLQESELKVLQANDHWRRVYQCRETKQRVVVTLVAGASGPLASHQPEICYARNEFCSLSDSRLWTVPNRKDEFRFLTLEPRDITRPALSIVYAWHDGEHWRAPRVPRIQFAGHATLERIQITVRYPSGMARETQAAVQRFVQLALAAADVEQLRVASRPTLARYLP